MKTLATCSPVEFLVQTNKIRRSVERWLSLTKVMDIRKRLPAFADDMSEQDRKEVTQKQVKANINAMLDAVLEEYPAETAELLGLLCFIEPDDLKNHTMLEFIPAVTELLENQEVLSFFTSLAKLGRTTISAGAKASGSTSSSSTGAAM